MNSSSSEKKVQRKGIAPDIFWINGKEQLFLMLQRIVFRYLLLLLRIKSWKKISLLKHEQTKLLNDQ